MTLLDHAFPEHKYTEEEKKNIEINQKINNMRGVISKYTEEIEILKIKLSEVVLKENIVFKDDILNELIRQLNSLIGSLQNKESEKKSIKVFNI